MYVKNLKVEDPRREKEERKYEFFLRWIWRFFHQPFRKTTMVSSSILYLFLCWWILPQVLIYVSTSYQGEETSKDMYSHFDWKGRNFLRGFLPHSREFFNVIFNVIWLTRSLMINKLLKNHLCHLGR